MQASADSLQEEYDPDNQLSSRLFRAGRHEVVAATRQAESDPDYAPSSFLMRVMAHPVIHETWAAEYDLHKQPSSSFWKGVQSNGQPVSGAELVSDSLAEQYRLASFEEKPGPDYASPFYTRTQVGTLKSLRPIHNGLVFEEAGERPDRYTTITPAEKAMREGKYLEDWGDDKQGVPGDAVSLCAQDGATDSRDTGRHKLYVGQPGGATGRGGGVEEDAGWGVVLGSHTWSRLTHDIYFQVLKKTGYAALAQSMAYGIVASMAGCLVRRGLFLGGRVKTAYEPIARRVSQVIDDALDSIVSDLVAEWGAGEISQNPDVPEDRQK